MCNTGGPPGGPDALGFTREQWQAAYTSLVLGPMALVEAVVPGMRERGFGRVVNVAGTGVREAIPNLMLSNAHRISMINAFKTIARQVAADGVTLNTVLPGRIDTDRLLELLGSREAAAGAGGGGGPRRPVGDRRGVRGRRRAALLGPRELRDRRDGGGRRRAAAVGVLSRRRERRSTPRESRTPATSVKGTRANHYTMGAGPAQSRGRFPSDLLANMCSCEGRTRLAERHSGYAASSAGPSPVSRASSGSRSRR